MCLPLKTTITNDSNQRIKIDFLNGETTNPERLNLDPGEIVSRGSVRELSAIRFDIIINPKGPDNNERLGGFAFTNWRNAPSEVGSDTFGFKSEFEGLGYAQEYNSRKNKTAVTWGLLRDRDQPDLGLAPSPTVQTEAFFPGHEIFWDFRILTVPDA